MFSDLVLFMLRFTAAVRRASQEVKHKPTGGVSNRSILRQTEFLYADGSVKWSRPFSSEAWNANAPQAWARWAKE
jgi:hypothetical protein